MPTPSMTAPARLALVQLLAQRHAANRAELAGYPVDALIESLQDAAPQAPEHWQSALDMVCRLLGTWCRGLAEQLDTFPPAETDGLMHIRAELLQAHAALKALQSLVQASATPELSGPAPRFALPVLPMLPVRPARVRAAPQQALPTQPLR